MEQHLTANVNQVKEETRKLREQLQRAQLAARKQLTALTVQSSAAAKKLQAAMAKVRRLRSSAGHACAHAHCLCCDAGGKGCPLGSDVSQTGEGSGEHDTVLSEGTGENRSTDRGTNRGGIPNSDTQNGIWSLKV